MNIRFGLKNECFKLTVGNGCPFDLLSVEPLETNLKVIAGRGDWAAVQAVICCDEDCVLNVGNAAWIPCRLELPVIRLAARIENPALSAELHIIDMHEDNDNCLRADALLTNPTLELKRGEVRSVFCEVSVPEDTLPGRYTVCLSLYRSNTLKDEVHVTDASITVEVMDCVMPTVATQKFHLDLWQHTSNIARKHETPLWSEEHFSVLEQYAKSLGELGQKAVTLVVSEIPWAGQNCFKKQNSPANLFEYSIVPVTRHSNGEFSYDFTKMERYIDICAKYGIDREISIYGLVNVWGCEDFGKIADDYPDGIRLRYLDERDGSYRYADRAEDIDAYVKALEQYFIATGQMEKVRIAADEPSDIEAYRTSLGHLMEIAPAFKCKAAINHAEFVPEFGNAVNDFVPFLHSLSREYDKICEYKRTMKGKRFMWYVCCDPKYPNTFLSSNLIESWFIGVFTSYAELDGFLRWSYTVWNDNPRKDIRYGDWRAGDTCLVYPSANGAPLLSLRYKALKRGIQLYELLERLRETGDSTALKTAYGFVVRLDDVRKYRGAPYELEDMCSVDSADYTEMKRYLMERLG